jgi:sulfite reductase alpha subunit-like flavoprotein
MAARAELLILYGSQTGVAQEVAELVELEAVRRRFTVRCMPMDAYPLASLPRERLLVTVCSTTGQGEAPDNMRSFWRFLLRKDLPAGALGGVLHAVFGLGDSSYPKFNVAARRLAARLGQLGSAQLAPAGYGDDQDELGAEQAFQPWLTALWAALDAAAPMPAGLLPLPLDAPSPLRLVVVPAPGGVAAPLPAELAARAESVPGGGAAALVPVWQLVPPRPPPGTDARSPLVARVAASIQLCADANSRDVRHLELLVPDFSPGLADLTGLAGAELRAAAAALPLPHAPGDALGVWPRNSDAVVARALARLRQTAASDASGAAAFDGDALVEVLCAAGAAETMALTRPLPPGPLPLRDLLATYVDLSAPPRRAFCAALARCEHAPTAEGDAQRARLREFASAAGQALLREYAVRPRRSVLEVLEDFALAAPSLDCVLTLLPPMQPRFYSISSEPETAGVHLLHDDGGGAVAAAALAVHLCVARVRYTTFLRDPREGLCSSYLAGLEPEPDAAAAAAAAIAAGEAVRASALPAVRVWFRAGALRLPTDDAAPLVMVGPGTGVAPFRAFVQRRARLARPPVEPSAALFFGCRSAALDHLFREEWAAAQAAGVLAAVPVAFSRDGTVGEAKTYVQTVLGQPGPAALVRELIGRGGSFYVAGAAGAMPRDVRAALVEALRADGGSEADGEAAVRALERAGRYQVEVWG